MAALETKRRDSSVASVREVIQRKVRFLVEIYRFVFWILHNLFKGNILLLASAIVMKEKAETAEAEVTLNNLLLDYVKKSAGRP